MEQRVKHEVAAGGCGGWLRHDTDAIGRTRETCDGCGASRTLGTPAPVAAGTARKAETLARREHQRAQVLAAVPDGEAEAVPYVAVCAAVPLCATSVREHLRALEEQGAIVSGWGRRVGRGPGQRVVKVYWREG